jgi:predicted dithiol-disulfide oxidoreductase (DUF899 family)
MLIAYYFMWNPGAAAADQCEVCSFYTSRVRELSFVASRDVTYATFCQACTLRASDIATSWGGIGTVARHAAGRTPIGMMHLVCYLRDQDRVSETCWTTIPGVETMDNNYRLLDLPVCGRQEPWEDSPAGWPQQWGVFGDQHAYRINARPIVQWARIESGRSDDLSVGS